MTLREAAIVLGVLYAAAFLALGAMCVYFWIWMRGWSRGFSEGWEDGAKFREDEVEEAFRSGFSACRIGLEVSDKVAGHGLIVDERVAGQRRAGREGRQ